jgi:hypothetical protein
MRRNNSPEETAASAGVEELPRLRKPRPPRLGDGTPVQPTPTTADVRANNGQAPPPDEAINQDDVDREERDPERRILDAPALAHHPEPVVEWIVEDIVPIEHATIVSGNGGTGKTTLIAQLMAAMRSAANGSACR